MDSLTPDQAEQLRRAVEEARTALDLLDLVLNRGTVKVVQDLLNRAFVAVTEAGHVVIEARQLRLDGSVGSGPAADDR